MITIKRKKDGISIKGHANYAPHGQDIVCASVSVLVQTLIQSIEELTADRIEYSMRPGKVKIKYWSLSDETKALISSFFIGAENIAAQYPEFVQVINEAD
jgi:uncharacterized protein YsxB (DUF464 family)